MKALVLMKIKWLVYLISYLVLYIWKQYSEIPLIAGNPLEFYTLQRKNEINLCVKVKKDKNWAISSQVPNRKRFNDYEVEIPVKTSVLKLGTLSFMYYIKYGEDIVYAYIKI